MHVSTSSYVLWLCLVFLALSWTLSSAASVMSTAKTTTTTVSKVIYPSLIQCVCNTTLASSAVITTSTASQKKALPSCLKDVFAETGIRWYLNGPMMPGVTYWRQEPPKGYSTGRAAQRLIRLGYRCSRVQLYDSTDPYY